MALPGFAQFPPAYQFSIPEEFANCLLFDQAFWVAQSMSIACLTLLPAKHGHTSLRSATLNKATWPDFAPRLTSLRFALAWLCHASPLFARA